MFLKTFYFCFPGLTTVYYLSPRTYHIVLFVSHDLQNFTTFHPGLTTVSHDLQKCITCLPGLSTVYNLCPRELEELEVLRQERPQQKPEQNRARTPGKVKRYIVPLSRIISYSRQARSGR